MELTRSKFELIYFQLIISIIFQNVSGLAFLSQWNSMFFKFEFITEGATKKVSNFKHHFDNIALDKLLKLGVRVN
jgi:hypothetical protein